MVALRKGFRPHPERTARRYLRRTARYAFLQHRQHRARDRWEPESDEWLDAVDVEWERRAGHRPAGPLAGGAAGVPAGVAGAARGGGSVVLRRAAVARARSRAS